MDIIDLTLKNLKLNSSSTGELKWDTGIRRVNLDAKLHAGYWEFDSADYYECWYDSINDDFFHVFHIITINNVQLSNASERYLDDFSRKAQDIEDEVIFHLEDFINNFYADPNLFCFKISNLENPLDRKNFDKK